MSVACERMNAVEWLNATAHISALRVMMLEESVCSCSAMPLPEVEFDTSGSLNLATVGLNEA